MLEDILLLSGNDIPFYSANIFIHQPTIKEIAYVGEENFFTACQLVNLSIDQLEFEDDSDIKEMNNFDILLAALFDEKAVFHKLCFNLLLSLLFPKYLIKIETTGIYLTLDEQVFVINKENYEEFQDIVKSMFTHARSKTDDELEYKPANDRAEEIAAKLLKGRQKLAEQKGESKSTILSRYVSILTIGLRKDMNSLLNYTIYQLFDEFKRFQLYQTFEMNIRARLAGATDLDEVENWMEDIHPNK